VRAAASTFRQNPAFDTEDAILHLGVGEALVSMLGDKGAPEVVDRVLIAPPSARVGPITPAERAAIMAKSPFTGKYDGMIDRESAFEVLRDRAGGGKGGAGAEEASAGGLIGVLGGILGGLFGKTNKKRLSPAEIALRSAVQSAARSAGTQIARQILRGVLGGMSR
jgi:hypothetical protein